MAQAGGDDDDDGPGGGGGDDDDDDGPGGGGGDDDDDDAPGGGDDDDDDAPGGGGGDDDDDDGPGGGGAGVPGGASGAAGAAALQAGQAFIKQIEQAERDGSSAFASAAYNGIVHHTFHSGLSVFTISGASHLDHDGFSARSNRGKADRLDFQASTYGLTSGVRFDASPYLGLAKGAAIAGIFGNYTQASVDIAGNTLSDLESYAAGGYALLQRGPFYFLGIGARSWADAPGAPGAFGGGAFTADGYVTSGSGGFLLNVSPKLKADFRGSLTYARGEGDSFADGAGVLVTDAETSELIGSVSVKLLGSYAYGGTLLRPFIQAGVSESFDYDNTVTAGGEKYRFEQDSTSVFARLGIDIDTKFLNSYAAIKGEIADDREIYSGQIGVTFTMD